MPFVMGVVGVKCKSITRTRAHSTKACRHYQTWMLLHPQGQKMQKITKKRPFFSSIVELVREMVTSNMDNKFGKNM